MGIIYPGINGINGKVVSRSLDYANRDEARAGDPATKKPLKPEEAVDLVGYMRPLSGRASAEGGSNNTETMTPLRTEQWYAANKNKSPGYVIANDYSDGSGAAANDDAALTVALATAIAQNKALLISRPFKFTSEKLVNGIVKISGADGVRATLTATAAMRSFFNVTSGAAQVDNFYCDGSNLAQAGIRVEKGHDNLDVKLSRLDIVKMTQDGIAWIDGDMPIFTDIRTVNVPVALNFYNNGMNGTIRGLYALGGMGLKISRNASAPVPFQMEGTDFHGIRILPSDTATTAGVLIEAGLALRFFGLLCDQIYRGFGVRIIGTAASPVDDIQIFGIWCGGGASPDPSTIGFSVAGVARNIQARGGSVCGFPSYGAVWNGTPGVADQDGNLFEGVKFFNNGCDLLMAYSRGALMYNRFESAASGVYEVTGNETVGIGNYFKTGPQQINATSQYIMSRGPGAMTGIPLSSTGLNAGKLWRDGSAGGAVKII
ncbi:MAG TPA: hypothetical protein VGU72_04255 [Beijerinckiaceae bacterium]|nr:hypothetical protein [Beijerinckiaceae bacterium]